MTATKSSPRPLFPQIPAVWLSCLAAIALSACGGATGKAPREEGQLHVVTSATMVTEMVESIGGEKVVVDGLMGPGIDPHLFRPSVSDIRRLSRADAVFYVGLRFEEMMQEVLKQRAEAGHKVFAISDTVPREKLISSDAMIERAKAVGLHDPHIWFDTSVWVHCVDAVVAGLTELDPESADYFEERGAAYRENLKELHEWAKQKATELPVEQRVLITSHDAYNYFGRAYDFEVIGLVGVSTSSEAGLADITRLVDLIKERKIPAIFVETSVSPRAIQRVSRDSGAVIGGEIYSDALGPKGEQINGFEVGTYAGMVRYNLSTIVQALKVTDERE